MKKFYNLVKFVCLGAIIVMLIACGKPAGLDEYNQGIQLLQSDPAGAKAKFEEAIAKNADLAEAHLELGKLALANGDDEGAIASLEQAANLFETKQKAIIKEKTWQQLASEAYGKLAIIYSNKASKAMEGKDLIAAAKAFQKAAEYSKKAVEKDSANSEASSLTDQINTQFATVQAEIDSLTAPMKKVYEVADKFVKEKDTFDVKKTKLPKEIKDKLAANDLNFNLYPVVVAFATQKKYATEKELKMDALEVLYDGTKITVKSPKFGTYDGTALTYPTDEAAPAAADTTAAKTDTTKKM